jgi:predicted dehydrogenase
MTPRANKSRTAPTAVKALVIAAAATMSMGASSTRSETPRPFRLMTLDPGHFHAALVQKYMYDDVDPNVYVYAPRGDDLDEHLKRIERFNARPGDPTRWRTHTYTGTDFFQKMLADRPGNIVVLAGNNAHKTDSILHSIEAGLNVLADKPMAITPAGYRKLERAFELAQQKNVLLYDIMTERFEITSVLQRALSQDSRLFGGLHSGSPHEPAISKESVHHFSKVVAGAPLIRPQWFFDVEQEGEGIVDVTTHLVDLVQWQAFPEQPLRPTDAKVLQARRWSTPLTLEQFKQVTGANAFPDYLAKDVRDGVLHVYSNGEFTYRLKDIHARISVIWNFEAPPGAGDTHFSTMRGSRATLTIRQGENEQYKPVLYIDRASTVPAAEHDAAVQAAVASLQENYPGVSARRASAAENATWVITVPDKYSLGHEAHFAEVTANYLRYLRAGKLPAWEVPNMLTKYATIMQAYELSRATSE